MQDVAIVETGALDAAVRAALEAAGADAPSVAATTRAVMHASRHGVDSHGVRLVPHYCKVLKGGRVNPAPQMRVKETSPVAFALDADNGLGHGAAYRAMEIACEAAGRFGIAAVGVHRSSHFGAAGAYALAGAEAGRVALAMANSDSVVALHEGAQPFHGTNPFAAGVPVAGARPWLLDMATSSVPLNRVYLYRALGLPLPADVAVDAAGAMTADPHAAAMLMPAGGSQFGFKGAALGGLMTILSAILTGATADPFVIPMDGEEIATPRNIGHFVIAIEPAFFGGAETFASALTAYLDALRGSVPREGARVMAPGDREWAVERQRAQDGIPVDRATATFLGV
ncbi:Ldh family oxidoreductase [Aureimonas sp. AU12]|uniref:Ldh family oxidoreductase n=1 Tax=Aureimonas sp. AU12 TaxID=1638161 RepID=UPI000784F6F7|nr:Ldh family oxidoreductase [Aureimonas sp. AU12]